MSTYSISYSNTNNTQCFTDSNDISDISGSEIMYNLTGLQEATEYSITVTAILSGGSRGTAQDSLTATTLLAGKYLVNYICKLKYITLQDTSLAI